MKCEGFVGLKDIHRNKMENPRGEGGWETKGTAVCLSIWFVERWSAIKGRGGGWGEGDGDNGGNDVSVSEQFGKK